MEPVLPSEFTRSSFCSMGQCVEARYTGSGVEVRDSKSPGTGALAFTPAEWTAFVAGVKNGEFDI
ncbi:DUF397 domain-containing protein [Pseudonocardia ailaonensis]|uniref:DUF397 domain-containing protein n=1 Tax=Pseudonocardia ailaonensis TaxID=367279 RepID=UPI003CD091E0